MSADVTSDSSQPQERRVEAAIRALLPTLVASEARVARVFLSRPQEVIHRSAAAVGEMAGTSDTTVVRCCHHLGFKGFQDLKIALAQEALPWLRDDAGHAPEQANSATVLSRVLNARIEAIRTALSDVDQAAFERVTLALRDAKHVLFVGFGQSADVGFSVSRLLPTLGVRAEAPLDQQMQLASARLLEAGDACVAISYSGETKETVASLQAAADAGALTVALTAFHRSSLTRVADVALVTRTSGSGQLGRWEVGRATRFAFMAILDALFAAVLTLEEDDT